MSSVVESEVGRGASRPLSAGLWTLLSWLRRDSSSSSDSISSAGSDRTALSFAFLHPRNYHSPATPVLLRPLDSPTNSYKKRVRDSDFRSRYDRDITLHRKYGLYRGENSYDAFSLPPARRLLGTTLEKQERDRRATSEYLHRRSAHVPGKRRAPLPPPRSNSAESAATASVTRRHSRKRPAPQPPVEFTEQIKENIEPSNIAKDLKQMNSTAVPTKLETEDDIVKRRLQEKYRRSKSTQEKGFFKHIFDHKKRYSATESHIKLLPNISELDREAAEIIESRKLKILEQNNDVDSNKVMNDMNDTYRIKTNSNSNYWFCTKCLRKYDSTVDNCLHCVPKQKELYKEVTAPAVDDKQKLKEMLKEMKHSLPKRQNGEIGNKTETTNTQHKGELETPTLRIGSISANHTQSASIIIFGNDKNVVKEESSEASERVLLTQNVVVLNSSVEPETVQNKIQQSDIRLNKNMEPKSPAQAYTKNINHTQIKKGNNENAPLSISTLLNPVYIPKKIEISRFTSPQKSGISDKETGVSSKPSTSALNILVSTSASKSTQNSSNVSFIKNNTPRTVVEPAQSSTSNGSALIAAARDAKFNLEKLDRHSRRRELVNQLEQSIAKGDERAAAEAAAALAQLKVSCSVLSFTSQIVGDTSTSAKNLKSLVIPEVNKVKLKPKSVLKVNTASQCNSDTNKITDKDKEVGEEGLVNIMKNKVIPETPKKLESKINKCSIKPLAAEPSTTRQSKIDLNMASIEVWVEDREAARGPIKLNIPRRAVLSDLRRQAQASLGLAMKLQRWIVGTALCANDDTPLISLAGPDFSAPFYLCVVESESTKTSASQQSAGNPLTEVKGTKKAATNVYSELVQLELCALVANTEQFECAVCLEACPAGRGAVLRECVHTFCRECLADVIRHCEEPAVSCPATGCPRDLQEREIRALVSPDDYEKWLARGLAAAESGTKNAFHCRTKDCTGWAMCDPGVRRFPCPVCKHTNCVQCQAIHEDETCDQHRAKLQAAAAASTSEQTDEGTLTLLENLIARGEALVCPECKAIITKKWGCDWIKCSACKTEICWVTRGRRWGPAGRGDISSGCRCGVDGKRCHPSCGYCH